MRNPIAAFVRGRKGTPDAAGDPTPPAPEVAPHPYQPPQDIPAVLLTIVGLDLTAGGSAEETRLQLKVNVRYGDPPTMIRSWRLMVRIADRYETGQHVDDASPGRRVPVTAGYGGTGQPTAHERLKSLQFLLPGISRQEFLDQIAGSELVLTATDELGTVWSARLDLIALEQ